MDAFDLIKWREMHFGLDRRAAAKALGIAFNSLRAYEGGKAIPAYLPLACAAVANGIGPWALPEKLKAEKKKNPNIAPSTKRTGNPNWIGDQE